MNFILNDALGNKINLNNYKGKVLLIVNTAIKCRYTNQYYEFEELYEKYKDKDFEILDFPCNQFGSQAPGTSKDIFEFCEDEFDITFKIFEKVEVNGKNAHPLFTYLKNQIKIDIDNSYQEYKNIPNPKRGNGRIKWNFTKFLIDKKGNVRYRFSPEINPKKIEFIIEELLKED